MKHLILIRNYSLIFSVLFTKCYLITGFSLSPGRDGGSVKLHERKIITYKDYIFVFFKFGRLLIGRILVFDVHEELSWNELEMYE